MKDSHKQKKKQKKIKPSLRQLENNVTLLLIPTIFIVILMIINLMNKQIKEQIYENRLTRLDYQITVHPYPLLINALTTKTSAQSAIVMEADSQVVLYAKNPTVRFSMASTSKIMTALVGLEYYQKDSVLSIKTPKVEGSHLGFYKGEKFYFMNMLYAMMLPSSNEAAYAVADNYPGGKEAFIQKMNQKARQLNLTNTYYGDPAGLNDDQNFSTVADLARLSSLAIKNPTIAQIVSTKQKTITDLEGNQFYLNNLNQLLGEKGINGIKTGTTAAAGEVLVTSALQNGHTYIIIVMRSDQRFVDTLNLVSLITDNVKYIKPTIVSTRY